MSKRFAGLASGFLITIAAVLLSVSPAAYAQGEPTLTILSPAGGLTPSPIVRTSFVVSFTLTNFQLTPPGTPGLTNSLFQGHIHVFFDGAYYALWDNAGPIPFNNVAPGNHTIQLQLVNNDHTAFVPDISKTITVEVTDAPVGNPTLVILSPAGALNTNTTVRSSFKVSFLVKNYLLTDPVGQPNALNTGHIHIFLDGVYYGLTSSLEPISFDNIPVGQHKIELELVTNNHQQLIPDISQTITVNVSDAPFGSPSLAILSPAGALNSDQNVGTSFKVSYLIDNFKLVDPVGQANAQNTGHIHVFLDGKYYSIVSSEGPIAFDELAVGQHTIKLQLVNNDHSVLSPDVSKTITVTVTSLPVTAQVDLSGLINGQSMLQNWAMANTAVAVIALLLIVYLLMRKK